METRDLGLISSLEDVERFTLAYLPNPASTKKEKELWIFVLSLPLIATHIPPPFSVYHQDQPDFKIICGNKTIGIEVTVAVPQNVEKSAHIAREKELDWYSYSPELYSTDSTTQNHVYGSAKLLDIMKSGKTPPWYGNAPEAVMFDCIISAVNNKRDHASKYYTGYNSLLLIVYENARTPGKILELPSLETAPAIDPFEQVIVLSETPHFLDALLTNKEPGKKSGDGI